MQLRYKTFLLVLFWCSVVLITFAEIRFYRLENPKSVKEVELFVIRSGFLAVKFSFLNFS
jgi:hypothetical protein